MSFTWQTTAAGRAAISTAIATGPLILLPTFKVGSGVAYTPSTVETALHGATLYTGSVGSVAVISNGTVQVNVTLDTTVGDFSFGECALYLSDGVTLFAIGALPALQAKRASSGGVVGDRINLQIFITEANIGVAVNVTLTTVTNAQLVYATSVDSLLPPIISGSNAYLTYTLDSGGAQILAMRDADYYWTFPCFSVSFTGTTTSVGTTATLVCSALTTTDLATVVTGKYIVEITSGAYAGYCRMVTVKSGSTITWATAFAGNVPSGVTFKAWTSHASGTGSSGSSGGSGTFGNVGTISMYYGTTPPSGTLELNGGEASRTTFSTLYAFAVANAGTLVSEATWPSGNFTFFGVGDGSTTFRLPDWRGLFGRGLDNGRGVDPSRVLGSYQADAFASHAHNLRMDNGGGGNPSTAVTGQVRATDRGYFNSTLTEPAGFSTETVPKNAAAIWIISAGVGTPAGPSGYAWFYLISYTFSTSVTVSSPTSGNITISALAGTITAAVISGSMPTGLSLSISGSNVNYAGTPTGSLTTYNFVVRVTHSASGQTKDCTCTITVEP